MYLKTINIKNYRLLNDVEINLDTATTLIVGQNNTGKTSMMNLMNKVTQGDKLAFHDYPISCRDGLYKATTSYLNKELSYSDFTENVLCPSIKFTISYDLEDPNQSLGALVPFIIDTDIDTTTAIILAEYRFSISEEDFKGCFSTEQILFLEEPESHMHPQLQQTFVKFLTEFLNKISVKTIQVLITTHSSHIANAVSFNQIRYVQKQRNKVLLKDLNKFYTTNKDNADFIHKYLTINRCDLFFADKAILIEGTAERLLIPDMIKKCGEADLYKSKEPQLPSQYYSLIEVGGAYAHKFPPFLEFLGIPSLIITDIDSVGDNLEKTCVSEGKKSSNATINLWVRRALDLEEDEKITLDKITTLEDMKKTNRICRIEYQTHENGLCGRSLEEAIINANRTLYEINANPEENDIKFGNIKKTDFALDLLLEKPDYEVPAYIKSGLCWLDKQKSLR